ncbi:hypothetical protein BH09MYX1_BH09MYX1_49400 [soil metagenome]
MSKSPSSIAASALDQIFEDLAQLLKNPDVITLLADRGVNASLALLAADGLQAYLRGEKARAAEDFSDFAHEVRSRIAQSREGKKGAPS